MGTEIKTFWPNISVYKIPHSIFGGYGEKWRRFFVGAQVRLFWVVTPIDNIWAGYWKKMIMWAVYTSNRKHISRPIPWLFPYPLYDIIIMILPRAKVRDSNLSPFSQTFTSIRVKFPCGLLRRIGIRTSTPLPISAVLMYRTASADQAGRGL